MFSLISSCNSLVSTLLGVSCFWMLLNPQISATSFIKLSLCLMLFSLYPAIFNIWWKRSEKEKREYFYCKVLHIMHENNRIQVKHPHTLWSVWHFLLRMYSVRTLLSSLVMYNQNRKPDSLDLWMYVSCE